jgi:hypothetical protein
MLDEGEFHPAAVKPVFGNLLLRGGVVPPRVKEDSLGMLLTSKDLPDLKPKWGKVDKTTLQDLPDSKPKWGKVDKTTLHDLINDGSVEDSLGDDCSLRTWSCSNGSDCCKYKLPLHEAS